MADNYVDVPVLVEKLLAGGTIAAGNLLGADDSTGFIAVASESAHLGMMALEPATSGYYFSAMVIGTAWFGTSESIKAGQLVKPDVSNLAQVDRITDSYACRAIGTILDGAADSTATRTKRVLLRGLCSVIHTWGDT